MDFISRGFTNLSTEYFKNPRLAQLVFLFLIVYIVVNTYAYNKNAAANVENGDAPVGGYSHASAYVNITAMKHDMFKQMTIDILPPLIIFGLPSLIYWSSHSMDKDFVPILRFDEIISFSSYKEFMNSIIGRSLLTVMGYFLFYQIIQPYLVNRIPFF